MIGDIEPAVKARAEVFPTDHRRQLDELLARELLAEFRDLLVGRCRRRAGKRHGVVKKALFKGTECIALFVACKVA